MGYARQHYNSMPAIWRMAKFTTGKRGPIELILPVTGGSDGFPQRQNRRESLGGPENRLPVERLFRISCEKRAPIFFGIGEATHLIAPRQSDP
jgi:hypothetical protein